MLTKIYKFINSDEEDEVCPDMSSEACEYVPRNFFLQIFSNVFSKLGDTLSNPKTVLTWLMTYVSAPVYLISLIVPIRESGAMVPQVLFARFISSKPIRKWIWVVGAVLQFASICTIGIIAINFTGNAAGWLIVGALILFSLSRSVSSLASKDVMGKTIPKTKRGRLKGLGSSVSGVLVLLAGLYLLYQSRQDASITFYSSIIFFASITWLVAGSIFSRIKEFPSEVDPTKGNGESLFANFGLLKTNKQFRDFIIARTLLLCTALSSPFYVVLAQKYVGKDAYLLGLFIIANGIAAIFSAPVWGRYADRSSKNTMALAVLLASVMGMLVVAITGFMDSFRETKWIYPVAFFILGVAHEGVRLGRKTYIVDMASGDERINFVAVSNTIIGLILLVVGGLSALVSLLSVDGVIAVLSVLGLIGAYKSYRLPNVEKID